MKKSIHKGHCQVCGGLFTVQNSENDTIATHGYTKDSYFGSWTSGACWGSDHQPIEISNSCVEESITRAKNNMKLYVSDIEAQMNMTDPIVTKKWHKASQKGLTANMLNIVDISDDAEDSFTDNRFEITWQFPNDDIVTEILTGSEYEIKEKYCSAEIRRIEFKLTKIKSYVKQQQEILDAWKEDIDALIKIKEIT